MKNSIYACMHLQKQIHVSIIYIHAHSFSSRMIALKKKKSSLVEPLWAWPCCLMQNQRFPPVLIGCNGWRSCCSRCKSLWTWSKYSISDFRRNLCDWCCRLWTFCGRGRDAESVVSTGMWLVALADGDGAVNLCGRGRDAESVIGINGIAGCEPLKAWSRRKMIHGCV